MPKNLRQKIPFGKKNDRMYTIHEVHSGKACGCVCANCQQPLIAKKGHIMVHHFAHAPGVDACSGGIQTAIHEMAIQIIAEQKRLTLPTYDQQALLIDINHQEHRAERILIPAHNITFDHVETEYHCGGYIVDATGFNLDCMLHVEVKVTHAVDEEKTRKVRLKNENMIEIDLSTLNPESVLDIETFTQTVLNDPDNRHWITHIDGDKQYQASLHELIEHLKLINGELQEKWHKDRDEQRKREQEEHERQRSFDSNKENHRKPYQSELEKLNQSRSHNWLSSRDAELAALCPKSLQALKDTKQLSGYLNVMINKDWAVKAHRMYWQYELVHRFVFRKKDTVFDCGLVTDWLTHTIGLLDWVMTLHHLKQDQKKIGKERGKTYGEKGAWFLEDWENRAIPHPFAITLSYLNHLAENHLLERINTYKYRVRFNSPEEYLAYLQHQNTKIKQANISNSQAISTSNTLTTAQKKQIQIDKDRLIQCIVNSEKTVFYDHNGSGSQCQQCLRSVKRHSEKICPFCGGEDYCDIEITETYLTEAVSRYRCKPIIYKILKEIDIDYESNTF